MCGIESHWTGQQEIWKSVKEHLNCFPMWIPTSQIRANTYRTTNIVGIKIAITVLTVLTRCMSWKRYYMWPYSLKLDRVLSSKFSNLLVVKVNILTIVRLYNQTNQSLLIHFCKVFKPLLVISEPWLQSARLYQFYSNWMKINSDEIIKI